MFSLAHCFQVPCGKTCCGVVRCGVCLWCVVMWCGVVCCGVCLWCVVVWCGVLWCVFVMCCDLVWCAVVCVCDVLWCGEVWRVFVICWIFTWGVVCCSESADVPTRIYLWDRQTSWQSRVAIIYAILEKKNFNIVNIWLYTYGVMSKKIFVFGSIFSIRDGPAVKALMRSNSLVLKNGSDGSLWIQHNI